MRKMREIYDRAVRAVGLDRVTHGAVCCLVTLTVALASGRDAVPAAVCGAVAALCLGLLKECWDGAEEGNVFDTGDLWADLAGTVAGFALCLWLLG